MASSSSLSPLPKVAELLEKHTARELCPKDTKVLTISSTDSATEGFKKIVANNVLSAPVRNQKTGRYEGFLDTRELVQFVVFQAEEEKREEELERAVQEGAAAPGEDLRHIFDIAARFYQKPIDGITSLYLARTQPLRPVLEDDSLLKVAEILSSSSVHRVPVFNSKDEIVGIISQSTLVQFLYEHIDEIKDDLRKTVDEAKLGTSPVICVKSTQTALETFRIMSKYNRSGIAVIDEDERLLGCTSGSDLKLFIQNSKKNMKALRLPIMDFLGAIRRAEVEEKTRSPTITVSSTNDIERVLGKLSATHVHRLFVADDDAGYKPVTIISITDLLKYLLGRQKKQ